MLMIKLNEQHYVAAHTITEVKVEGREDRCRVTIRQGDDRDMLTYRHARSFQDAESMVSALVAELRGVPYPPE